MKLIASLMLLLTFTGGQAAQAQEMSDVRIRSCSLTMCSLLTAKQLHRSNFQPGLMAFGEAALEISSAANPTKVLKRFAGGDGYFDIQSQVIVLRGIKRMPYKELIFNLSDGKFIYF